MIVDIHAHPRPGDPGDKVPELARQCGMNGVSLVLNSLGTHLPAYPSEEEVRKTNDVACEFARGSGGLCRWLAYLNPQNADWRNELERCIAEGAVGVKLLTSLKDAEGRVERTAEVIRGVAARGLSTLIHTWQKTSGNSPGEITLEEFAWLAEQCPEARMVGAHSGGNWRHSIGVLRERAPNAHVDVSGYYPERGLVEALVRDIGADRILFGSDLLGRTQASQLAKVVFADISDEAKRLIFGANAARVFNLRDLPPPRSAPLRPVEELPDFKTDHFCFCGRWPFFEGRWVTPAELDELLGEAGIEKAYTGDFDSLYRQDLEPANNRFLEAARATQHVAPLATMNPLAHNWHSVIRHLRGGFAGVIVHPYLHNWRLDDAAHAGFFRALSEAKLPVWVNCALGDDRTRHSGLACRPVAAQEAVGFCEAAPKNEYVFQGLSGDAAGKVLERFKGDMRFRFDMSKLTDYGYAWDRFVGKYGRAHLVAGSEFPLRDLREVRWTAQRI